MTRYARRKDENHNDITQAFCKLGYKVLDLSRLGSGCPDIIVGKGRQYAFVEIKVEKGKLRANQQEFREWWPGFVFTARSVDDVLEIDRQIRGVVTCPGFTDLPENHCIGE